MRGGCGSQTGTPRCKSGRSHQRLAGAAAMAFPHRPDAPELPDFSMLKRLARDQLIYLLEQVCVPPARPGRTPSEAALGS